MFVYRNRDGGGGVLSKEKTEDPRERYSSVYISLTMGSNMFSLEPDLATGNMVLSQISMRVRALLPATSEHFVHQA